MSTTHRPESIVEPSRQAPSAVTPPLAAERERVIEQLSAHFASDHLQLTELEHRLDRAYGAESVEELRALVADLPSAHPAPPPMSLPAPSLLAPPEHVPERGMLVAVMGGQERGGSWIVPRHLKVVAVMGGALIDLRQARFAPGVTDIEIFVAMGGVEVLVPPGVRVEDAMGATFMGGFEHRAGDADALSPDHPVVRLSGIAFMGGVEAATRYPGESARDARRREKELKKLRG
jgi:hypothetical protein